MLHSIVSGMYLQESCVSNTVKHLSQLALTFSKLTIETLEQGVKYVQS